MSGEEKVLNRPAGAPVWLVTFADLMALLFALFVLILSFSDVDSDSFKRNAGPMAEAFNQPKPDFTLSPDSPQQPAANFSQPRGFLLDEPVGQPLTDVRQDVEREKLVNVIRVSLSEEIANKLIELDIRDGFIILRFPGETLFAPASADLTREAAPALMKVAKVLSQTAGNIFVSGHTDNQPISTDRYRSNWDLSSARAVTVVHRLLDDQAIKSSRVSAVGLADTQPLSDNATPEGRAVNRRVEIKVEIPTGN